MCSLGFYDFRLLKDNNSVFRHSVPDSAEGVRSCCHRANTVTVPYLHSLWILHYKWLLLALDTSDPREEVRVDGAHMLWRFNLLQSILQKSQHSLLWHITEQILYPAELCDCWGHSHVLLFQGKPQWGNFSISPDINFLQQGWAPVRYSQDALSIGASSWAVMERGLTLWGFVLYPGISAAHTCIRSSADFPIVLKCFSAEVTLGWFQISDEESHGWLTEFLSPMSFTTSFYCL